MDNFIDIILRERQRSSTSILSDQLLPETLRAEKLESSTNNYWNKEIKFFGLGYKIAMEELKKNPDIFFRSEIQGKEGQKSIKDCYITQSDLKLLSSKKTHSLTLQELMGKPSQVLMAFYVTGQMLFDQKKFTESQYVFTFLTLMNQNIPSFWIGRGCANEALENWDAALECYWMAQSIDPECEMAYVNLIRIYNQLKDEQSVNNCLKCIEERPNLKQRLLKD